MELADELDQYGLRIPRVTFSYSENDKALQRHAIEVMSEMLEAAGGRDLWVEEDTSHLNGTCRMGDDPNDQRRPTPGAAPGTSPTSGSATARCSAPWAGSTRP